MRKIYACLGLALLFGSPVFAGSTEANPPAQSTYVEPKTPEERRAYKIAVLERWIVEDKGVIANPGDGKAIVLKEKVKIANQNLKMNEDLLAKIKGGADHEVYFCSHCGQEYMKEGTCPHCKIPTTSGFAPGAKRPPIMPHA